jgi:hypothetical protein
VCLGLQAHPFCILFPRFRRPLLVALDQNPYIHCPSDKKKNKHSQIAPSTWIHLLDEEGRGGERRGEEEAEEEILLYKDFTELPEYFATAKTLHYSVSHGTALH